MTRNILGPIEDLACDLDTIGAALEHLITQIAMHPIPADDTEFHGIRKSLITAEMALSVKTKALTSALAAIEKEDLRQLCHPK